MSSENKNRRNAPAPTSPKPQEKNPAAGKTGARDVIASEKPHKPSMPEDFDQLAATMRHEFQPNDVHETFLVDQMIQARWRVIRIQYLEKLAFDHFSAESGGGVDPSAQVQAAVGDPKSPL